MMTAARSEQSRNSSIWGAWSCSISPLNSKIWWNDSSETTASVFCCVLVLTRDSAQSSCSSASLSSAGMTTWRSMTGTLSQPICWGSTAATSPPLPSSRRGRRSSSSSCRTTPSTGRASHCATKSTKQVRRRCWSKPSDEAGFYLLHRQNKCGKEKTLDEVLSWWSTKETRRVLLKSVGSKVNLWLVLWSSCWSTPGSDQPLNQRTIVEH